MGGLKIHVNVSARASRICRTRDEGVTIWARSRGLGWHTRCLFRWRTCWTNSNYSTMRSRSANSWASNHSLGTVDYGVNNCWYWVRLLVGNVTLLGNPSTGWLSTVHAVGNPSVSLRFLARPQWLFEGLWKLVERFVSGIWFHNGFADGKKECLWETVWEKRPGGSQGALWSLWRLAQGVCLSLTKPLMSLYVMVALETALLVADMIDMYCFTMLYISSVRFRYDQWIVCKNYFYGR